MSDIDQAARRAAEKCYHDQAEVEQHNEQASGKYPRINRQQQCLRMESIIAAEFKGLKSLMAVANDPDPLPNRLRGQYKCGEGSRQFPVAPIQIVAAAKIDELAEERDRLAKDVNELNALLREVGWGQGEIDSAATVAEENESLRALLVRARKCMNLGCSDVQLLADIDAALALGENNG